jgi:hypothetical protein
MGVMSMRNALATEAPCFDLPSAGRLKSAICMFTDKTGMPGIFHKLFHVFLEQFI